MEHDGLPARLGAGVAAGLVGTIAIQGMMAGSRRWAPQTLPAIRRDPAEFMVGKAKSVLTLGERGGLSPTGEAAAEKVLGIVTAAAYRWLRGRLSD